MPIIVIKSRTQERITGTYSTEYSCHIARRTADGTLYLVNNLVSRKKAQKLVREHGLVLSHNTQDGEIYDTPTGSFKALFPNGIQTMKDMRTIETVDKL